jgi:hypothetical protein
VASVLEAGNIAYILSSRVTAQFRSVATCCAGLSGSKMDWVTEALTKIKV